MASPKLPEKVWRHREQNPGAGFGQSSDPEGKCGSLIRFSEWRDCGRFGLGNTSSFNIPAGENPGQWRGLCRQTPPGNGPWQSGGNNRGPCCGGNALTVKWIDQRPTSGLTHSDTALSSQEPLMSSGLDRPRQSSRDPLPEVRPRLGLRFRHLWRRPSRQRAVPERGRHRVRTARSRPGERRRSRRGWRP